jgi:threonine dehydrogenase-like Zn-dependent dehydrogenase
MAIRRLTGPEPDQLAPRPQTRVTGGYWERPTQTGNLGVDVAVETSGSIPALHDAIRATRFGGTICMISFYGRDATGLYLGDEFHVNRLQLVSARAETLPGRDAPVWDLQRLVDLALAWLASGRVRTDGIVTPIVPFAESAEAYRAIDERPAASIKLGIQF